MRPYHSILLAAIGTLAVWFAIDRVRWLMPDPIFATKLRAARTMQEAISVLRAERMRSGPAWDDQLDPNHTGLIGRDYTDLTTTLGSLAAKRTTTNPNMAGLVVELLDQAGAGPGDAIAVSFSGSFPALNVAVLAAASAMELRPVIISSVGASSYGANDPAWTWLDIERVLAEHGNVRHRTRYAALGGIVDEQGGLDGTGLDSARAAIRRNGVPMLDEGGRATFAQDVQRRWDLFHAACGGKPRVFVNVGGSLTSLGGDSERHILPPGLIRTVPVAADSTGGLIARMAGAGVPVIHLLDIRHLSERFGLPFDPQPLPAVPDGSVMRPQRFGRPLAGGGLAAIGSWLLIVGRRSRRFSASPPSQAST